MDKIHPEAENRTEIEAILVSEITSERAQVHDIVYDQVAIEETGMK